ncbi:MAG: acyltransferase [Chromatiales bacterium]|jgi:1-acyl-sn-glycerol-3-phosphate acyltransferase|nr:acyltransferase [Chromatiales bacterium]
MRIPVLATLRGSLTISLFTLNVILWFIPILAFTFAKLLVPLKGWHKIMGDILIACAENWISFNKVILALTQSIRWDIRGLEQLERRQWYLMISNHQSWVDILALQAVFNRRIPFLKFFIKHQLIWVPFLGIAWWALDMPFMKRYTREYLERHPEMRGRDLEATRKACEKFRDTPTTVINFVEGTRSTEDKRSHRESPYRHLMPPRAGGAAFALGAMGDILHALIDVTIVYGDGAPSLWDLCCGRVKRIVVDVRSEPIESWITDGDYMEDAEFRQRFQDWLSGRWQQKDELIGEIIGQSNSQS